MKYFLKILFHRVTYTFLMICLQLFLFIAVIIGFNEYFVFFYAASIIISMFVVLWVVNNKSNPAYKIAWIIPILIFPVFGGLFYLMYGKNRLNKRTKRKMESIGARMKSSLPVDTKISGELRSLDLRAGNQSDYITNYSYCPAYGNTYAEYLPSGEAKFERLKEELKKAERFIFMEYFIINKGLMWDSVLEILVEKVRAGVDVRLIYDDVGCMFTLPYNYNKTLEQLGIKCCVFNPLVPVATAKINNRDHRKIVVIDGRVGFTGGVNLADEYINVKIKYGHWKDNALLLRGEAVWSLTVMFLTMWEYLRGGSEDYNKFRVPPENEGTAGMDGYIQPFADSPFDGEPTGEIVYFNMINKANRYVYITTPYLIINNEMVTALTSAAKAGVDVRIITPHHPDKKLVFQVTKSYYSELIEAGVRIFEYSPGFIHEKTFIADDEYGVVGTINLDYRSLFLHFECGVWIFRSSCLKVIKQDYLDTLKVCREVKLAEFGRLRWYVTLGRAVLRVFSPLL